MIIVHDGDFWMYDQHGSVSCPVCSTNFFGIGMEYVYCWNCRAKVHRTCAKMVTWAPDYIDRRKQGWGIHCDDCAAGDD
jgi:hypothetical protein